MKEYCCILEELNDFLKIEVYNQDFFDIFENIYDSFKQTANLLFFDQNGYKFITEEILKKVNDLYSTDYLFFVSSSYGYRFKEVFSTYIPDFEKKIKDVRYEKIHEYVTICYQDYASRFSDFKYYPFSIKKNTNIYGIIFASKHPRGIDKFLRVAWKENPFNGNANFDIEDDMGDQQMTLFGDGVITKVEIFQRKLESLILNQKLKTNCDVYDFTLEQGHIPNHAKEIVLKLKNNNKICFSGHACISYESCYKNIKRVRFEKNEKNKT